MQTTDFKLAELVNEHTFFTGFGNTIYAQNGSIHLSAHNYQNIMRRLPFYISALRSADLLVTVQYAESVLDLMGRYSPNDDGTIDIGPPNFGDIKTSMLLIIEGIRAELNTKSFVAVPPRQQHLYEDGKHFGEDVAAKFPSLAFNINEAGKCLALGRWTAAAFHSILSLEGAIRGLTRHLGIADPTTGAARNWTAVGRSVGTEMSRRWPAAADKMDPTFRQLDKVFGGLQAMQNPSRRRSGVTPRLSM